MSKQHEFEKFEKLEKLLSGADFTANGTHKSDLAAELNAFINDAESSIRRGRCPHRPVIKKSDSAESPTFLKRAEIEDIYISREEEIEMDNKEKSPKRVKVWQIAAVAACACIVFAAIALSTGYLQELTGVNAPKPPPFTGDGVLGVPTDEPEETPTWDKTWQELYEEQGEWTDEVDALFMEQKDHVQWIPPPMFDESMIDLSQTGDLVIWIPPWSSQWLIPMIDAYKEIYPNVNVIIENFDNNVSAEMATFDWQAYPTRMATELAAGKGPDIMFPHFMWTSDIVKMANAGAFLDLNDLIEQDEDFSLDDYYMPIIDSGIYRGKRYIMPFGYDVSVYIASTKALDEIGFDRSQTGDMISFINEIVRVLPKAQANPSFMSMFSTNFSLLREGRVKLVDFETDTILPDEEGLKKLLEAFKPYNHIASDSSRYIPREDLRPQHLLNGIFLFAPEQTAINFFVNASRLKAQGDFEMFAMPGIDGKVNALFSYSTAIRSGSPNAQNAWNFIKLMLSPGVQGSQDHGFNLIPVHKDSLIAQAEFWRMYCDSENYFWDDVHKRLSDAELQAYLDIITNAYGAITYDTNRINGFFWDNMDPFFNDEVSYETAIAGLRNQLRLYVSE
jgi:ABC-type glycerol-3-phosphate transport system substrate-binding protein